MGKCSFQHSWLDKSDTKGYKVSSWAQKKDDSHIWCFLCETSINISKGFQAISQHSEVKRHIRNVEIKYGSRQLHLTAMPGSSTESDDHTKSNSKPVSLCSVTDQTKKAELIWAMKCISANYSGKSCSGISSVFRAMFPEESIVLNDFSLGPTKFFYLVTEALGPYFKEKMLEDVSKSYYSLLYDETTNNESKKELQIGLKFWSEKKNEVITCHLTTIFMGSAKADEVSNNILRSLDKDSLSLSKLIMIGSDGPPVNAKVFRIVNEEVKSLQGRTKGLLQVGTCNLHTINNTFLKGLDVLGHEVSELIISVYYYFHGWPLRNEEYAIAQEKKRFPTINLLNIPL